MQAEHKRMLRSNRGNALILAVLMIVVLSSVGIVAVQRTNTDLMVSGNITRSTQAYLACDAGMQHALALVGNNTEGYLEAVRHQKGQASCNGPSTNASVTYRIVGATTAATAMPPPIPGPCPGQGDPDTENLWLSAMDSATPQARALQDIAYNVNATWVGEQPPQAGNSQDIDICHEVYDFNSQGAIPTRIEAVTATMSPLNTNTVVVNCRARASAGPIQCKLTKRH
jgi:hypothetical protein